MSKFIGIDPGLKGGIAILVGNDVELHPMPLIGEGVYDLQHIKEIFTKHCDADLVCIEQQSCRPGEGLSRTFTTGMGFGILLGMLSALELRHDVTSPQRWQRSLYVGLKKGQDPKVSSEIIAKRLFPKASFLRSERSRVTADGLTDAACIAEFARRQFRGNNIVGEAKPHSPNPANVDVCLKCGVYLPASDEYCII